MIPLRLRLKNFLGYRDAQELSLEGVHLACLSGDNGAGKSALLDAMTWALWGQARCKSADDVVHLGQSETEVELEFGVDRESAGDGRQRYRVLRKHRRGAPGRPSQSILEFQAASNGSPDKSGWQPLTGNGVRETQRKITDVLRLDYETFINSAFLLQGRADAFTVKKASERKELLAEILGLSFYDELERRAKERRKESEAQVRLLDSELESIARELALKGAYEGELKEATQAISVLEPQLHAQETSIIALRQKQGELQARQQELEQVSLALGAAEKELANLHARQQEHYARIKAYEAVLGQRADIEAGHTHLLQARREADLWNDKLQTLSALQQQQNHLEHIIRDARTVVEGELALVRRDVSELEGRANALPQLQQSLATLQARFSDLAIEGASLEEGKQATQHTRDRINELQTACAQMAGDLEQAAEHIGEATRKLEAAKVRRVESEKRINGYEAFLAQREEVEAAYAQLQASRNEAEVWNEKLAALNALEREQSRLEHIIKDGKAVLERELAISRSQVTDLETKSAALPVLRKSLAEMRQRQDRMAGLEVAVKEKRERAQELRDAINRTQAELDQLGKDISSSKEKLSLLTKGDAHCPLCETDLGIEGKERLESKYQGEIEAKTQARAVAQASLKASQARYLSLTNELRADDERLTRETAAVHAQMASLQKEIDLAQQADGALTLEREKLESVRQRLDRKDYALSEQEQMGKVTSEIASLGYDPAKHRVAKQRLLVLAAYEVKKRQLEETGIRIQAERLALSQIVNSTGEIEGQRREIEEKRNETKGRLESQSAELEALKQEYSTAVQELARREKRWESDKSRTSSQLALVDKDIDQAKQAENALPERRDKLSETERRLAQKEYAAAEQQRLSQVTADIAALGYDHEKHKEVKQLVLDLEKFESRKRQLDEAEIRIQAESLALSATSAAVEQTESRVKELQQRKNVLGMEVAGLPDVATRLLEAERTYRDLQAQERACRDRIAAAQSQLDRCQAREQEKAQKEELRLRSASEEAIFRDLAEAFGQKGVPALLIEAALPELEVEANRLLGRMTDNRLSVKLETQREHRTGKGEPIETLDIKISDELGTRDYEMFSGGEAFRINFALRIALSKLLARRAGAPLPTLVIDEGFGTQDSSGREKLVDAINSVQGDFERILVITHIDELKDLFPVRIEVTKTSEGSTFRVT